MQRRVLIAAPAKNRAGLAPLEFVLALPLLLFTMALMINLGTAGAWKVRSHTVAREGAWRSFAGRSGASNPRPAGWPQGATVGSQTQNPKIIGTDPYATQQVVRGPVLSVGQSWVPVDRELFDIAPQSVEGSAAITRPLPLMERMPPHNIDMSRKHPVMEGTRWQFWSMKFGSNLTRRALYLYPFDLSQVGGAGLAAAFVNAALEIIRSPRREDLTPLEGGDPEVRELLGENSPDFQPKLRLGYERATIKALRRRILRPTNCSTDPAWVQANLVEPLKRRIRNVPQQMKNYYIGVYQRVIDNARQNMQPIPPGIEDKLRQVKQFRP